MTRVHPPYPISGKTFEEPLLIDGYADELDWSPLTAVSLARVPAPYAAGNNTAT